MCSNSLPVAVSAAGPYLFERMLVRGNSLFYLKLVPVLFLDWETVYP